MKNWVYILVATILFVGTTVPLSAEENLPQELKDATITEKLGAQVDIQNLKFKDETGAEVSLSKFFTGTKPVLLTMVYYQCPNLCNFLLNGVSMGMRSLKWSVGEQFDVVSVSINPNEGSALAAKKKAAYLKEYGRIGSEAGWHFLTGSEDQIKALASQIGFGFYYDEKIKEYAHASALFVLTPTGKVSRLLYGIDFPEKNLRLALLEASDGKIGTIVDRFLMFCYQYNPDSKGYAMAAMKLVQAGGMLTMVLLFGYLFWFWRREKSHARLQAKSAREGISKP